MVYRAGDLFQSLGELFISALGLAMIAPWCLSI